MRSLLVVQFLSPLSAGHKWDWIGTSVRGRGGDGRREARNRACRSVAVGRHCREEEGSTNYSSVFKSRFKKGRRGGVDYERLLRMLALTDIYCEDQVVTMGVTE